MGSSRKSATAGSHQHSEDVAVISGNDLSNLPGTSVCHHLAPLAAQPSQPPLPATQARSGWHGKVGDSACLFRRTVRAAEAFLTACASSSTMQLQGQRLRNLRSRRCSSLRATTPMPRVSLPLAPLSFLFSIWTFKMLRKGKWHAPMGKMSNTQWPGGPAPTTVTPTDSKADGKVRPCASTCRARRGCSR